MVPISYYVYTNLNPTDIYPVQYGSHICDSGHSFGPWVRSNYLIHYVYKGCGVFRNEYGEFNVKEDEMFLIRPEELTYYRADTKNPWQYAWIEFNGSLAEGILRKMGFAKDKPVISDNGSCGRKIKELAQIGDLPFEAIMQKLWGIFSEISERDMGNISISEYIKKAESYIKINIHNKVTVSDVAKYIGIDRSHLSRLFRRDMGVSPQQYIISLKMKTAANYLKNKQISVSEAAQSVGYGDIRIFNKAFKREFGMSPSLWRKREIYMLFVKGQKRNEDIP